MNAPRKLNRRRPWRNALIASTVLSMVFFVAAQLWSAGFAQWAFAITFLSTWSLLAVLWSNDDYIEESNLMLAGIIDHNFDRIHERLQELEQNSENKPADIQGRVESTV